MAIKRVTSVKKGLQHITKDCRKKTGLQFCQAGINALTSCCKISITMSNQVNVALITTKLYLYRIFAQLSMSHIWIPFHQIDMVNMSYSASYHSFSFHTKPLFNQIGPIEIIDLFFKGDLQT